MANVPLQEFTRKETCKAHRHMTPTEYALWDVCMGLSHSTRVLYFDGRKLADRFKKFSKSVCYRAAASLLTDGWFEPLDKKQKRTRGGTYAAKRYKVLTHDEWIARYGTKECLKPDDTVPTSGNGDCTVPKTGGSPFPESSSTVPKTGGSPFPPAGHSFVVKPCHLTLSVPRCENPATPTPTPLKNQGQETTRASDGVYPAVPAGGNGVHSVPGWLEYDARYPVGQRWGFSRDAGTPTAEMHVERDRLNRERVTPEVIQ